MSGVLDGIRVLDVGIAAAGPIATRMLASLGADVIKVESPAGDRIALFPPTQRGHSVLYACTNVGKKSIKLDLKSKVDREAAHALIKRSDVFVNNMRSGVVERLGIGYEVASRINPRIVYAHATGWGWRGPMKNVPAADYALQAFSGWASIQGADSGRGELTRAMGHLDETAAACIVGAVLQGLIWREHTGRGQKVDISMLGCSIALQTTRIAEYFAGHGVNPMGSSCATTVPHEAFLCQDERYLAVGVMHDKQWFSLCRALGSPDLENDPRFATNPGRVQNRQELLPLLRSIFKTKPTTWWSFRLSQEGVPNGLFYDWETIRYHTHVCENQYIRLAEVPGLGMINLPGIPWEFSESQFSPGLPPLPGQDTDEVLNSIQKEAEATVPEECLDTQILQKEPRTDYNCEKKSLKALAGVKVIDITQGLCGPYVSQLLADAGAEVIKVEPPQGDYSRQMGPPFIGSESAVYLALNRNKKSIGLDLEQEEGREVLKRLAKGADVFLEDLGPEVAGSLGFGYPALCQANSSLIYCAITPFGEKGPLRNRTGAELVIQAMADYPNTLGSHGDPPERIGADIANINTAMVAFDLILAATLYRDRCGKGQRISISMYGTLLYHRSLLWASYSGPDEWSGLHCDARTNPPDYGYETKDGSVYFYLGRTEEIAYYQLLNELGLTHVLADSRFLEAAGRETVGAGKYAPDVKPIWEQVFKTMTSRKLMELAEQYGATAIPVNDYTALFSHPQVQEIGLVREMEHPISGKLRTVAAPWTFSELTDQLGDPPPLLGQHTKGVLLNAGYTEEDMQTLLRGRTIMMAEADSKISREDKQPRGG